MAKQSRQLRNYLTFSSLFTRSAFRPLVSKPLFSSSERKSVTLKSATRFFPILGLGVAIYIGNALALLLSFLIVISNVLLHKKMALQSLLHSTHATHILYSTCVMQSYWSASLSRVFFGDGADVYLSSLATILTISRAKSREHKRTQN